MHMQVIDEDIPMMPYSTGLYFRKVQQILVDGLPLRRICYTIIFSIFRVYIRTRTLESRIFSSHNQEKLGVSLEVLRKMF